MKHKGKARGVLAALAALVVALTVTATPAKAEVTSQSTQKITITGLAVDGENKPTVNLYRIIDVNFNAVSGTETAQQWGTPQYIWNSAIAAKLEADDSLKQYVDNVKGADYTLTQTYTKGVSSSFTSSENTAGAKAVYEQIRSWIGTGVLGTDAPAVAYTAQPDDNGTVTVDASMGGYLIDVVGGPTYVYQTMVANVYPVVSGDGYALTVSPSSITAKSSKPTVTKSVAHAADGRMYLDTVQDEKPENTVVSATVGDTLTYTVTVSVPTYATGATNTTLIVDDVFDAGLTYVADSLSVSAGGVELTDGYTLTTSTAEGDGTTKAVSIVFDYSKIKGGSSLKITYNAKVNKSITPATAAKATTTLTYANKPYVAPGSAGSTATATATVSVCTYGIRLYKTNELNQPLAGAKFCLIVPVATSEGVSTTSAQALTFEGVSSTDENGNAHTVYMVTGAVTVSMGQSLSSIPSSALVESDDDGYIYISGIDEGAYTFKEIYAPTGYTLPKGYFDTIELTDTGSLGTKTGKVEGALATTGLLKAYNGINVQNIKSENIVLPTTGGMGVVGIVAGGVVAASAGYGILSYLRRSKKNED